MTEWRKPEKIVAISASPRMERGATDTVLQAFLAGTSEAGADCETIYPYRKNINPCRGCFSCWTVTPGKCVQNDEMSELLEKLSSADMLVFATPLYYFTMSFGLKLLLERTLPLAEPFIVCGEDGHSLHPRRVEKKQSMVLISVCGFPERDIFDALKLTFHHISRAWGAELVAEIFCPMSSVLLFRKNMLLRQIAEEYLATVRSAGIEIVERGRISDHTLSVLQNDFVAQQLYIEEVNKWFRKKLGLSNDR